MQPMATSAGIYMYTYVFFYDNHAYFKQRRLPFNNCSKQSLAISLGAYKGLTFRMLSISMLSRATAESLKHITMSKEKPRIHYTPRTS